MHYIDLEKINFQNKTKLEIESFQNVFLFLNF